MAESILFNLAGNIITKLGSFALRELGLFWGVLDELDKLKDTVSAIKAVLLDAEEKQSKDHAVKDWLSKLKVAFYEVDDLIDEFSYETLRRKVIAKNRKKTKQVRIFFSKSNQIAFGFKMGHKIKETREKLKAIDADKTQFRLVECMMDMRDDGMRKGRETHSFIPEGEVIGRDDDKKAIINLLLNTNTKEDIAVIAIVGIGGLGKTALAQSVYNDNMMMEHFELKLWVCISEEFDVKIIIEKIVESATKKKPESFLQIDSLQRELRGQIDGKKYLLVMDDVWNENHEKWVDLKRLLLCGANGSRILITTRSKQVAETFDTTSLYSLENLDECNSWLLFKKMAFLKGAEEELENSCLVEIGKEIVATLKGVPLAIRTIGRLLYDKKSKDFWLSFKDKELFQVREQKDVDGMRSILKLSYNHLPSNLKQCFLYCALFPKDYEIQKDEVIMQWVAQGFIQPNDEVKPIDIGEDYFMELLSRSFFQDVTKNELGDIIKFKMHDLMHDLACWIVKDECVCGDMNASKHINKRTRHVSLVLDGKCGDLEKLQKSLFEARNLKTFFLIGFHNANNFMEILANFLRLRTLHLGINKIAEFPESISKLKHLRYLHISSYGENKIKFLPNSITELYNLETLILHNCKELKELPRDIKNWMNLKYLDISWNYNIEFLPNSITELYNLETLIFHDCKELKELPRDIKDWINLKHLEISWNDNIEFLPNSITELYNLEILIIRDCRKLKELPRDVENWTYLRHLDLSGNENIEFLPNSITKLYNLETLLLDCCYGLKELPRDTKNWIKLKHLRINYCRALTHMPEGLGGLTNLQTMDLFVLRKDNGGGLSELNGLNKLMGSLTIRGLEFCKTAELQNNAKYLQLKSGLQKLSLTWFNISDEPTISALDDDYEQVLECLQPHSNVQEISILGYEGVKLCNWVSSNSLGRLVSISLSNCNRLRHLPQFDQFPSLKHLYLASLGCIEYIDSSDYPSSSTLFPSLEELSICCMSNLRRWWKGTTSWESAQSCVLFPIIFPCLSRLRIWDCPQFALIPWRAPALKSLGIEGITESPIAEDEIDVIPWKEFQSLTSLMLGRISKWECLPECLQYVTTLQNFSIEQCPNLKSLPESIGNLTSLLELEISDCPKLTSLPEGIRNFHCLKSLRIRECPILEERCKKETGEDWPKIAHIPRLDIS